ncbi:MAG: hypothetical protein A2W95_12240 [Bacteroidetes bacterium GWA2_40_14]|jgi:hypothetical protein|nr:MAG: hypothetical protein A2W95_12240 [Bacteroidetes bacterium GWA2_40_14]HAZ04474.1 hypothetical protein [Marinilabiliales bacterium]
MKQFHLYKWLYLLSILFGMLACEKVYIPNLDTQESILAFEGLLTDQPGVHYVNITKSVGYNDDGNNEKGTGFQVVIEDSNGSKILLTESGAKGRYVTGDQVKGQLYHSYRLVATDPDGISYVSSFETLMPSAEIESISGEYHINSWLEKIDGVGYQEQTQEGVRFFNFTASEGFTPYYRYEYEVVYLSTQIYPTQPFATICYIARPGNSYSKGFVALANGNLFVNKAISHNPVDFISKVQSEVRIVLDSIELDSVGQPIYKYEDIKFYGFGYLLRLKQYSLSESGFQFWDAIYKQVNATGQLFDPVESQIIGNLVCASDSAQKVFGYFGVSAITAKSNYIYLKQNKEVLIKPIIYFPELEGNIAAFTPFDFWIY